MFLLNFIPDALIVWIVNIILISGIVGTLVSWFFDFFAKFIPQLYPIKLPLQIISLVLLATGVYFKGGSVVELKWRERVAELEAKIAIAETQSKVVNETIKTIYIDKVKTIKEQQIVIQEKIIEKEKIIDADCKIVSETLGILNDAAAGVKK